MILQFRNSKKYIKLTESNICNTQVRLLQDQRFRQFMKLCPKSVRFQLIILTVTERSLNISASLYMAFAAEAHRAEGHFSTFKVNIKLAEISKI